MHTDSPTELVELIKLDTSFAVRPKDEEAARRRLMTLLVSPVGPTSRLAQSEVLLARNTEGEKFALKRLRPLPADTDRRVRAGREAALFEEYRTHLAVGHLAGFSQVFGYGLTEAHDPVILLEWVDGMTLLDALPYLPHDASACTGQAVAAIADLLLSTLVAASHLQGTFVHRDISPRNVMLRLPAGTGKSAGAQQEDGSPKPADIAEALAAQIAAGTLQTCLVDLGSASFLRHDEASFTTVTDIWRHGTPEYAAPELLAAPEAVAPDARLRPAVDIYALCSVLYRLYAGRTPFQVAEHTNLTAYELKTQTDPEPLEPHVPEDAPLVEAIMSGIRLEASERPCASALLARINGWQEARGFTASSHEDATSPLLSGEKGAHLANAALIARDEEAQRARRLATRRRFLKIAGGAAAAVVLGGVAWYAGTFRLGDLSWSKIKDIANRIASAQSEEEALQIARQNHLADADGNIVDGLVKNVRLADGTHAQAQLIDVWHDELADGSGRAGLSFAFTEPLAARPMADSPMKGGWEQCDARAWMGDELYGLLPKELRQNIAEVSKLTNNAGATQDLQSVTKTAERLWLFSIVEVGGPRDRETLKPDFAWVADLLNAEGRQYRLYEQKGFSSRAGNEGLIHSFGGETCYWWLRTPSADCSIDAGQTWFNRVGLEGDPFHYAIDATGDDGASAILPGFCL